ncbi:hypothetical protein [Pedobacter gandavensis]|uniref:hypothetical protein n=1 Tax=Pedobacter gandavensis TaxID=2679963 RepID=UPI0029317241|nr:hypothetical protein [Pedobacter gandavensis]
MFKNIVRLVMLAVVPFFLAGCSDTNNKPLSIEFSADSSSIVFREVDPRGLVALKSMENRDSVLQDLVSVLQTPSEKDSLIREEALAGSIELGDSSLVFSPIQPFVKGRAYLVMTHLNVHFAKPEEIIKGKLSYTIKPQQKVLYR